MKLADIKAEQKKKDDQRKHVDLIVAKYKEGHLLYALALKQLQHHGLNIQQAETELNHP